MTTFRTTVGSADPATANADTTPVVALLHSLGTDARMWSAQESALGGTYRVVTPESRGHGQKPWKGPLHLNDWVEDLRGTLTAVTEEPVHLVGLSMGGVQALAYAQRYPGDVASLVLADTFAGLDRDVALGKISDIQQTVQAIGMASYAVSYLRSTLLTDVGDDAYEHLRSAIAGVGAEAYLASAETCFRADLSDGLGTVAVPTLVLVGDADRKTPLALAEALKRGIPDAKLEVIPSAGHLSNVESPRAFNELVLGFIASVSPSNRPSRMRRS